jgi:hypothetical protein
MLYFRVSNLEQNRLLINVINIISQMLLASLFYFLIIVLKRMKERRFIIVSFILYPVVLLLTIADSLILHQTVSNPLTITTGVLNILVVINLFIQALRIRKSRISIYYRLIAIDVFIIVASRILIPVLMGIFIPFNRLEYFKIIQIAGLFNHALCIIIPVAIILMIQKLKEVTGGTQHQTQPG